MDITRYPTSVSMSEKTNKQLQFISEVVGLQRNRTETIAFLADAFIKGWAAKNGCSEEELTKNEILMLDGSFQIIGESDYDASEETDKMTEAYFNRERLRKSFEKLRNDLNKEGVTTNEPGDVGGRGDMGSGRKLDLSEFWE